MKHLFLIFIFLLLGINALGQDKLSRGGASVAVNSDGSVTVTLASGKTFRLIPQATVPGTCIDGQLFYHANDGLYECIVTTWTKFAAGGGTGTVTSIDASGGAETTTGSSITTAGTIRTTELTNAQVGTSYAIADGDRGKFVSLTNASPVAVSIAQAGTGGNFLTGWWVDIKNLGAGTVTLTPTTSTIDGSATLVLTTGQNVRLLSNGTNYLTARKGISDTQRTVLGNTSGTNTGDQDLSGLALKTTTVNGHALSANVTVTATDVGLGNVDNTSDATKNAAAVSLTNKKLGSLTTNGPVYTSSGDGTLNSEANLAIVRGGTGTGSTLAGLVRGSASAMTAAELSGVVVTSGSNVTTPGKADVMQSSLFCSDVGSTDAYACSFSPAITAYVTGTHYRFLANTANTGAASINLNALGVKTIKKAAGGVTTDLADNDIRIGQWVELVYDGTNMQMVSLLGNAPAGSGTVNSGTAGQIAAYTGTGTAVSGLPNLTYVGGSTSGLAAVEGTAPSGVGSSDVFYPDSTAHRWKMNNNNGGAVNVVASGVDINASDQVTVTHLASALPEAQGGTGITALGTGVGTFLGTPSSVNLLAAVTGSTGSGALTFANTPTFVTPNIGAATGTSVNLSGTLTVGGLLNTCLDAGSTDTYACSIAPAIVSYTTGQVFWFKANTVNTGAATINFNSLGAKTVKKVVGGITTDLVDNDIRAGQYVEVMYDGTNMQMISLLGNAASGSGTVTVVSAGSLTSTALVTGGGSQTLQTPSATATMDASGNVTTPGSVTTGNAGGVNGDIALSGSTSGTAHITVGVTAGTPTLTLPTTTDTLIGKSTFDTLTNKSYDAESTGNTLTQPFKFWHQAAICLNATATSLWDLPTSTPAVAACVTGTNTQKGVLQYADTSGGFSAQKTFILPSDFTGAVDARIIWRTSATSGNVKFSLSTICTDVAASATDDPAFNTASTVTTAAPGTTLRIQTSSISTVTITGCAAGNLMHVKLFRDGNDAADTISASLDVIGVELTIRRAQ